MGFRQRLAAALTQLGTLSEPARQHAVRRTIDEQTLPQTTTTSLTLDSCSEATRKPNASRTDADGAEPEGHAPPGV